MASSLFSGTAFVFEEDMVFKYNLSINPYVLTRYRGKYRRYAYIYIGIYKVIKHAKYQNVPRGSIPDNWEELPRIQKR